MLPAVPLTWLQREANRAGRHFKKPAPRSRPSQPLRVIRGSNQTWRSHTATQTRARFPVYAGPAFVVRPAYAGGPGLSLGSSPRRRQSWTGRPRHRWKRPCAFNQAMPSSSSLSDFPPGCPKGKNSDHRCFVETRKGVPTSWAGTPDALYLDLYASLAKPFCARTRQKSPRIPQLAAEPANRLGISTFTPGPMVEEAATRLM